MIKCQDRIKKELSICQSLLCLDLVSLPVLNHNKPQAETWWCPSLNRFMFQACDHTPPRIQKLWFHMRFWKRHEANDPNLESAWLMVKTTMVPWCRGSPSFWINENILGTSPSKVALHVPLSLLTTSFATSSLAMFSRMKEQKERGQHAISKKTISRLPPTPPPPSHTQSHKEFHACVPAGVKTPGLRIFVIH